MIIIVLLGLGETTLGLTKKEANVSGGIAVTFLVVTFSILVFILNRFNVSLMIILRSDHSETRKIFQLLSSSDSNQ